MSRILTIACIAALAAGGALAQPASPPAAAPGNPATTPAGTPHTAPGTPAPDQLNDSDRLFSDALAAGGYGGGGGGEARIAGHRQRHGAPVRRAHDPGSLARRTSSSWMSRSRRRCRYRAGRTQSTGRYNSTWNSCTARHLTWPMSTARSRTMRGPYSSWSMRSGRGRTRVSKSFASETLPDRARASGDGAAAQRGANRGRCAGDGGGCEGPGRQGVACFPEEKPLGPPRWGFPRPPSRGVW